MTELQSTATFSLKHHSPEKSVNSQSDIRFENRTDCILQSKLEELVSAIDRHNGPEITRLVNQIVLLDQEKTIKFLIEFKKYFDCRVEKLIQLANKQRQEDNINTERQIYVQISFLSTVALIESNIAKRNANYKSINQQTLLRTNVMSLIAQLPFCHTLREVMKPLGLLFGNISKSEFTLEQRLGFKSLILRMLKNVTDPTVRYWYLLSLHRIVQEKNISMEDLETYNIYDVMLQSINSSAASTEVRYALKVITIFGGELYGEPCINKFYEKGLMNRLLVFMKDAPKMVFNFLEKMHGNEFRVAYPKELTKYFLQVVLDSHPVEGVDQIKAALRILRYKLDDLNRAEHTTKEIEELLLGHLEEGLAEQLCFIISQAKDIKERHYAFNVVKELLLVVRARLPTIYSLLIQSFLTNDLENLLKRNFPQNNARRQWSEIHTLLEPEIDFRMNFMTL